MGLTEPLGPPRAMRPPKTPPQLAWGPPRLGQSRFLGLLCLHNYSEIFQKRRLFNLLLGGTRLGYPPWGAPPRPLGPPQGSPEVTEFWKKFQKFSKIIWKIYMHQNIPNYNSNINFGQPGDPGGASGAQNLRIAVPGGYLKDRIWVL